MGWYLRSSRSILVASRRCPSEITLIRTPVQESFSKTSFHPNCSKPNFGKSRNFEFSVPVFSGSAIQNEFKSIRTPIQESFSRNSFYPKPSFSKSGISEFSLPIFSNSAIQSGFKSVHCKSPFLNGAKRHYYTGRNQVSDSGQTKSKFWKTTLVLSLYILLTVNPEVVMSHENLEIVPFSERSHYVALSPKDEKVMIRDTFERSILNTYRDKVLPFDHPESIRVQRIAHNIIEGLQRGLEIEKSLENQKSRDEGQVKRTKPSRRHLEGLQWDIVVVDDPLEDCGGASGGKIALFTGCIKLMRSDDEIAVVLAHQVARIVAQHQAEMLSKFSWCFSFGGILELFVPHCIVDVLTELLILPLELRLGFEGDYVGLLLMGYAGYDPRVAPGAYEKLGGGFSSLRAKLLSRSEVMEEAMDIYKETVGKSSM